MEDKSGVSRNAIALPSGGGSTEQAQHGFGVDELLGGGAFEVPIVSPPGRGGLNPDLMLQYSTGGGFGPSGLGWRFNVSTIERRLDVGIPTYSDDTDVFVLDGHELLQVGPNRFRKRTDEDFLRIERDGSAWRVTDRGGVVRIYGSTNLSRRHNPQDFDEVQAWYLERVEDLNGNYIQYEYSRDERIMALGSLSYEAAEVYLTAVRYNPHVSGIGFNHSITLHYDFTVAAGPSRPDARWSCRAGFPIYTGWRLSRVEVESDVPNGYAGLIRTYAFAYRQDRASKLELLESVTKIGHDDSGGTISEPPMSFSYNEFELGLPEIETLEGAPQLDFASGHLELVDLTGNGLPDILSAVAGNHTFWLNNHWRSSVNVGVGEGDFAPASAMPEAPNLSLLNPMTHLADVRGKVAADLFDDAALLESPSNKLRYTDVVNRNIHWGTAMLFQDPIPFGFSDGKTRTVDLTGNGRIDVLRADGGRFRHWLNAGDGDFVDRGTSPAIPGLDFNNPEWTFGDLTGDGLTDIVRVRNGLIEVYLNRGRGAQGGTLFETSPILMRDSQRLRRGVTEWSPERLIFIDITGSGCDDAIYLGTNRITYWLNEAGLGWSHGVEIPLTSAGTPVSVTTNRASIRVGNLLGTGLPCIVWSSNGMPMKRLDLSGTRKALLLAKVDNGVGGHTHITYRPSTIPNTREWTTRVPFTIHVVDQVERTDTTTGQRQVQHYSFLDGQYDCVRREFLGFAEVEVVETGDSTSPNPSAEARIVTTWFHEFDDSLADPIERAFSRILAGVPFKRHVCGGESTRPYLVTEWTYDVAIAPTFELNGEEEWGTSGLSPVEANGSFLPEPVVVALRQLELELAYDPASTPVSRRQSVGGRFLDQSYRNAAGQLDPFGRIVQQQEGHDVEVRVYGSVAPDEYRVALIPVDDDGLEGRILEFFNSAANADEIVKTIVDDPQRGPEKGTDGARQYGIRPQLADRILSRRSELGGSFASVHEIDAVSGVGPDTLHDIFNSFRWGTKQHLYDQVIAPRSVLRATEYQYAQQVALHIVELVAETITRSNGSIVANERRYYDGVDYIGLPLRQVTHGNLTRIMSLALREDQATDAYAEFATAPALTSVGYERLGIGRRQRLNWLDVPFRPKLSQRGSFTARPLRWIWSDGFGYFTNDIRYRYLRDSDKSPLYGIIVGTKDPMGAETKYAPDPQRLYTIETEDDAGNRETSTVNYRVSDFSSTTDANGHTTLRGHDALGRVTYVVRPGDSEQYPTTSYEYAPTGSALPLWVRFEQRQTRGNPKTHQKIEYRDGWGRLLQRRIETEGGQVSVTDARVYGPRGNVAVEAMPFFDNGWAYANLPASAPVIRLQVDPLDRQIRMVHVDGSASQQIWKGYAVEHVDREDSDAASSHFNTPTRYEYDAANRLRSVVQRNGGTEIVATYKYDSNGHFVSTHLPNTISSTQRIDLVRDLRGAVIQSKMEDGGSVTVLYDARGKVSWRVDGRQQVVRWQYDALGRLLRRSYPGAGSADVVYEYADTGDTFDPARNIIGRVHRIRDTQGSIEFDYDGRGEINRYIRTWDVSGTSETHVLEQLRDSAGRLVEETYPSSSEGKVTTVNTEYNEGGLLKCINVSANSQATTLVTNAEYDPRGKRTLTTFGTGVTSNVTYHPSTWRLQRIQTVASNGVACQDIKYCHDHEGNVVSLRDNVLGQAHRFEYDDLYRLRTVTSANMGTFPSEPTSCTDLHDMVMAHSFLQEGYDYSPSGDIIRYGAAGPVTYSEVDGRPHAIVDVGTLKLSFDQAGSLSSIRDTANSAVHTSFAYDAEGRLARVDLVHLGRYICYEYDYAGGRARKCIRFLADDSLISERRYLGRWAMLSRDAGANTWTRELYVWDENSRAAVLDDSGNLISVLHSDHLHSTVAITDSLGITASAIQYGVFGQDPGTEHPSLTHRFSGKERDAETGLVDFGERLFIPWLGRWAQVDPLLTREPEKVLRNPQALNPYAYSLNNPMTLCDPHGEQAQQSDAVYTNGRANPASTPNSQPSADSQVGWFTRFGESYTRSFWTTNKFFFQGVTKGSRSAIGFATAGQVANRLGTVTWGQAIRGLAFPTARSWGQVLSGLVGKAPPGYARAGVAGTQILRGPALARAGVGFMGPAQTIGSAALNSMANSILVAVALEAGITVGSTINAAFEASGVDFSELAFNAWTRWSNEDKASVSETESTPPNSVGSTTEKPQRRERPIGISTTIQLGD